MEVLFTIQDYNIDKLDVEVKAVPKCFGLIQRGTDWYVLIEDDATQPEIDTIMAVLTNHDSSPTTEQASELAKQALADGAETSKKSWAIIQAFNDSLEAEFANFGTATEQQYFDAGYTAWRTIYDGLPVDVQGRIRGFSHLFLNPDDSFSFIEPTTPDNAYKTHFMLCIRDFLGYITDRAQVT